MNKKHANDKPGSPQTSVSMTRRNGESVSILVCVGEDDKSFRVVLDDVIHPVPGWSTLAESVRRQQAAQSRRLWPESPEWWIDNIEPKECTTELLAALESAELSCTQARMAHKIGKKTQAAQIAFLLGQFEQLGKELRAAIDKATGNT